MKQFKAPTLRSSHKLTFLKELPQPLQTRSHSFKASVSPIKQSPVKPQAIFFNGVGPGRPKSRYGQPKVSQSTNKLKLSEQLTFIQSNNTQIHRKNMSDSTLPKLSPIKARHDIHYQTPNVVMRDINPQLIKSVAQKSLAGKTADKITKTNQDSYISLQNYGDNMNLFGVCDGHGQDGHKCSQFVKEYLPKHLKQSISGNSINDALFRAFQKTNNLLNSNDDIITTFSGSTTVICLIVDRTIYTANIGDSRAIICRQLSNGQLQSIPISFDHKPDLPIERKRIEYNNGRVEAYIDFDGTPLGPARVWMKDQDIPGLAMSRSFGDKVAASCGVISEPEITNHQITDQDLFMVIASDGVWEFLSNEQVTSMVYPHYQRDEADIACTRLVKESVKQWKANDEVIDDITAQVVFFNKLN